MKKFLNYIIKKLFLENNLDQEFHKIVKNEKRRTP